MDYERHCMGQSGQTAKSAAMMSVRFFRMQFETEFKSGFAQQSILTRIGVFKSCFSNPAAGPMGFGVTVETVLWIIAGKSDNPMSRFLITLFFRNPVFLAIAPQWHRNVESPPATARLSTCQPRRN